MSVREETRKAVVPEVAAYLMLAKNLGEAAWFITQGGQGLRGEVRVGYALGVLCAVETLAYRENE